MSRGRGELAEDAAPLAAALEGLPAELGFACYVWARFVLAERPPERPREGMGPWETLRHLTMGAGR